MMKPRSDSKLKNLPEDRQEQIIAWSRMPKTEECPGGLQHAREQLAADGIQVSLRALSEFVSWWQLENRFSGAAARAEQFEKKLLENPDFSPERAREAGQALFTMEAMASGDAATFVSLESLALAQRSAKTKYQLEREKLEVSKKRLQLVTCEKFLEWFKDERARQIADGSGTNAQKIEALGQAMFGEDW